MGKIASAEYLTNLAEVLSGPEDLLVFISIKVLSTISQEIVEKWTFAVLDRYSPHYVCSYYPSHMIGIDQSP